MYVNLIYNMPCNFILTRGERKGEICGKSLHNLCSRHKNCSQKKVNNAVQKAADKVVTKAEQKQIDNDNLSAEVVTSLMKTLGDKEKFINSVNNLYNSFKSEFFATLAKNLIVRLVAESLPVSEPIVEQVSEPIVEPVAEPIIKLVAEPIVEQVSEPIVDPVAEPIVEPVAKSIVSAVFDEFTEKIEEQIEDAIERGDYGDINIVISPDVIESFCTDNREEILAEILAYVEENEHAGVPEVVQYVLTDDFCTQLMRDIVNHELIESLKLVESDNYGTELLDMF